MLPLLKKILPRSRRRERKKSQDTIMAEEDDSPQFHLFAEFNDDIRQHILSFVADGPLELKIFGLRGSLFYPAALTTSLPLVCKSFYDMCQSDFFWEPAMLRQLNDKEKSCLFKGGLRRLLSLDFDDVDDDDDDDESDNQYLLRAVIDRVLTETVTPHKDLYQIIVSHHIRFEAPIFMMPCNVQIGQVYGLHLFEPRYRLMVRELMDKCANPQVARRGEQIIPGRRNGLIDPPVFIHACLPTNLVEGALACLVQIVWCRTSTHGTADVQLLPVSWVRIDKLWMRPRSGHLFYAKACRLN